MRTYAEYLASIFGPGKYQKLTLNAGHDCPNRDGTLGYGGCIYCSNQAFSPAYCHAAATLEEQLQAGRAFFSRKYRDKRWLPYFQTYTSTNADLDELRRQYISMLAPDDVAGMVVSTRPDALPTPVIGLLSSLPNPVLVEIGAETSHDRILETINRRHTWAQTVDAVERCAANGLHVGLHLIAGLPGDDDDGLLLTIDRCCRLPIDTIKLHHLQVLKGTLLAHMADRGEVRVPELTLEHYLDLCAAIVRRVPGRITIERFVAQAPEGLLISPRWGLKNYQFMNLLRKKLREDAQAPM